MSETTYGKSLALVTGGSSGMGLEYARQLAAKGCDLLLVSIQPEELTKAKDTLEKDFNINVTTRFQDLAAADAAEVLHSYCEAEGLIDN